MPSYDAGKDKQIQVTLDRRMEIFPEKKEHQRDTTEEEDKHEELEEDDQSSEFVQLPSLSDVNAEPRAQPAPQSSSGEGTNSRVRGKYDSIKH